MLLSLSIIFHILFLKEASPSCLSLLTIYTHMWHQHKACYYHKNFTNNVGHTEKKNTGQNRQMEWHTHKVRGDKLPHLRGWQWWLFYINKALTGIHFRIQKIKKIWEQRKLLKLCHGYWNRWGKDVWQSVTQSLYDSEPQPNKTLSRLFIGTP